MAESVFPDTARFSDTVKIINSVDESKLPLVLKRVVAKVDGKTERIFTESEEEQLAAMLSLSAATLAALLDGSCFVFERAAFHNLNAAKLGTELQQAGFEEAQVQAFAAVWNENRAVVLTKLRDSVVTAPRTLASIDWRLNLQMSQNTLCRLKLPTSIVEFHIQDNSSPNKAEIEDLVVEFGHNELYKFFLELEKVQDQLDALR